ncbi:MAG TPA: TonB-dependent receptor [Burkholderiales bacterium]|nr:TonB-dependent receptor [Burkholderiales bacterium]
MQVSSALARRVRRAFDGLSAAVLACMLPFPAAQASNLAAADIAELSLEQLANIVVTSVSRREERLGSAAASVYVISNEDIRRAGANTLPEALRLAPNLHVARADANQYAISARGFNATLANRLLVLIDGRIVYSPLFSGVFWEVQDVMLEDVDRIEVISGPGATLWGANAVNGVINVITRRARDTQSGLVSAGAGNRERAGAVRYGGTVGESGHYRVYAKHFDREQSLARSGAPIRDAPVRNQAGFRMDWGPAERGFTVQGDAYKTDIEQVAGGSRDLGGANLIVRWTDRKADGSGIQAQAYYDRIERDQPGAIREELDIFDAELQHGLALGAHNVLWGAGFRHARDRLQNLVPAALGFIPDSRSLSWWHVFAQDEWRLRPDLALTFGMKAEHNDYTGLEWLPSARFAWSATPTQVLWGAVSRAVRAPSRIDREFFIPAAGPVVLLRGGPDFQSEVAYVFELGYRAQLTPGLNYSLTLFRHEHQRLRSVEPGLGTTIQNRIEGSTTGLETWGSYRVLPNWRLDAGWVLLRQRLAPEPGSAASIATLGGDPPYWVKVRSSVDITPRHQLDVIARRVGPLPFGVDASYTAVDARFGWHVRRDIELSLLAQNLFDPGHPEWGPAINPAEHRRGVFVKAVWRP